jgi:hypothetical protein
MGKNLLPKPHPKQLNTTPQPEETCTNGGTTDKEISAK